jgi:hypothetical protein
MRIKQEYFVMPDREISVLGGCAPGFRIIGFANAIMSGILRRSGPRQSSKKRLGGRFGRSFLVYLLAKPHHGAAMMLRRSFEDGLEDRTGAN